MKGGRREKERKQERRRKGRKEKRAKEEGRKEGERNREGESKERREGGRYIKVFYNQFFLFFYYSFGKKKFPSIYRNGM